MNDEKNAFGLACRAIGEPAPILTGVRASGRLDGVLFELMARQTYRNSTNRTLEVVYTFPLPHQAVLLGFASELNGERKVGTIADSHEESGAKEFSEVRGTESWRCLALRY